MFDVGFSEILVIFVLALIVLGPEKLPRVASQVGRWIGRARGMARQFREQLEEEVQLEEARKLHTPAPIRHPDTPLPAESAVLPVATAEQAVEHPPTYSHAHATDSLGRPLDAPPVTAAGPAVTAVATTAQPSILPPAFTDAPSGHSNTASASSGSGSPAMNSHQQDWVANLTSADNPRQDATDAAYAPSNERGT
ncbi:MAG TPA: Sec-independent protein translocase protein TatB [Steroidobacteraceae bacterium]